MIAFADVENLDAFHAIEKRKRLSENSRPPILPYYMGPKATATAAELCRVEFLCDKYPIGHLENSSPFLDAFKALVPAIGRDGNSRINLNRLLERIVQIDEVHLSMAAETPAKSQSDKFKEAARELGSDEDEARWEDRLKKVVKHKPIPEKPSVGE